MTSTEVPVEPEKELQVKLTSLHNRLDTLWKSYLDCLDAYAESQKLLQEHMSAGFLSIARANFVARNGVRRYGKDFYHDRAIATRRVAITVDTADSGAKIKVVSWRQGQPEPELKSEAESEGVVQVEKTGEGDEEVKQQPSPPTTPEPEEKEHATAQKLPLGADSLRWFGILTPPALRSAQNSFSSAVDDVVVEAVNSARGMRECEGEIRRLRKDIRRAEREVAV